VPCVVIVTRDRPAQLAACLRALEAEPDLELLVVDDGSRDEAAVHAAAGGARVLRTPPRGVGAARNAGARAAGSELVCFTDDDCVPATGWAARLVARLEAGASVVAGPTVQSGSALAVALQVSADALIDRDAATTGSTSFAPGSNFACRRSVAGALPAGRGRSASAAPRIATGARASNAAGSPSRSSRRPSSSTSAR